MEFADPGLAFPDPLDEFDLRFRIGGKRAGCAEQALRAGRLCVHVDRGAGWVAGLQVNSVVASMSFYIVALPASD